MKKWIIKILAGVLVTGVAAGGVCAWQWDNITALRTSMSYSREDISQLMEVNDQKVSDVSAQMDGVTVRDLTEEEKAALQDESLGREEIIDLLIGKTSEETTEETKTEEQPEQPQQGTAEDTKQETPTQQPQQTPQQAPTKQEDKKPATETADPKREELARLIAEIYLMEAEYTAWLEQMHTAAIEEFVALPQEQQTTANKYKIGMAYMKEGLAKEDECDVKMAELQEKIRALLVELGEDTALVDEIRAAYEEEKTLKKAYYLGLHD